MAKLGDWRNNAALEIPLDGVGGVSLLVRAEVHRKGILPSSPHSHRGPPLSLIHDCSTRYRFSH